MNDDDHPLFDAAVGAGIWYLLFQGAKEVASSVKEQLAKGKSYAERMDRDPTLTMSAIVAEEAKQKMDKLDRLIEDKRQMKERAKSNDAFNEQEFKREVLRNVVKEHPEHLEILRKVPGFVPYLPEK